MEEYATFDTAFLLWNVQYHGDDSKVAFTFAFSFGFD
jgi:hypothetical protein